MKICTRCKKEKSYNEFYKCKSLAKKTEDSYIWECKDCCSERGKIYHQKHKHINYERSRKWAKENPERHAENQKKWRIKNKEKLLLQSKKWSKVRYKKLKIELLNAYGNKCSCCGGREPEFLTLEHINGDGAAHRKKVGESNVYRDLKRRGWPKDEYTLLCMNCNFATRYGDICPHKRTESKMLVEYLN